MLTQPVSLRHPEIGALIAGTMATLIRPIGRLAVLQPGDLLWVREPFHLPGLYGDHAPTYAARLGAVPIFVADRTLAQLSIRSPELGKRRNAREMLKIWHRQHLRVTQLERLQLRDVAEADLKGAGWKSRDAFEVRWDEDARFNFGARTDASNLYSGNPLVLRIGFVRVPTPLPEAAHPDKPGGSNESAARLNKARDDARASRTHHF